MSSIIESDVELVNLDTESVHGFHSDQASGSESVLLRSDPEEAISVKKMVLRKKRAGKRNRQRLQKKLSGLGLDSIVEEPGRSTEGTPKRIRTATGSTPEMAAKKPRTYATVVANCPMKKFCVRDINPGNQLNSEKLSLFRLNMSSRVLDTARTTGFVPQMLGCYLSDNVIICKCSNELTYKWFCEEVSKIKDIWNGCQLVVGDPPKPLLIHTWVPGSPEEPKIVLSNIGLLNPDVSIEGWKVIRCKREATRQSVVIKVDLKSFEHITGSGLSLQYVLEKIFFKIISGP